LKCAEDAIRIDQTALTGKIVESKSEKVEGKWKIPDWENCMKLKK
jgi:hypothetical protein